MFVALAALFAAADPAGSGLPLKPGWVKTAERPSEYATQAAAADRRLAYAVSNTTVAAYDRESGKLVATATLPGTRHLNSAFVWKGKVYCAHSNYPATPETSDIRAFDPEQRTLTVAHTFPDPPGSLVWNVHDGAHWWCCFAKYGADNTGTLLVKLTDDFRELQRWTFPKVVTDDWDRMSGSGGVWDDDTLLVSHHHFRVLYRLRLPRNGTVLEFVEALTCPFPGQGIAVDPTNGGLVGIDRGKKAIVFAEKK